MSSNDSSAASHDVPTTEVKHKPTRAWKRLKVDANSEKFDVTLDKFIKNGYISNPRLKTVVPPAQVFSDVVMEIEFKEEIINVNQNSDNGFMIPDSHLPAGG